MTSTIFLSFANEDASWKDNFTHRSWFGDQLGKAEIIDYKADGTLPFGPLNEWHRKQVHAATVFIAFVSKHYINKKYPLLEWSLGLSQTLRQNFSFVPILMDVHAKAWWEGLKQEGRLNALGGDYAYADFTDGNGRPAEIITPAGPVDRITRRISELARLIREDNLRFNTATSVEPDEGPMAPSRPVVVLGHPTARFDPEVDVQANLLVETLTRLGRAPTRWGHRWRSNAPARRGPALSMLQGGALFIQPVGSGEAGDLTEEPRRLRSWLEQAAKADTLLGKAGLLACRTVLWLPAGQDDETFATAASLAGADSDPALRCDDAGTLAHWLHEQSQGAQIPEIPVLTLEEVDQDDAGKLRMALHEGFHSVVSGVVRPSPELWTFQGSMLVEQIASLESDRAIVAVHDLNTGTATGQREARRQLEQKLGAITADVNRAIHAAKRKDLKLFWSALLVQKAEQLPWVKYPSPSQFENWCLLPFIPPPDGDPSARIVEPKPVSTNVFRTYLRDWVNGPGA